MHAFLSASKHHWTNYTDEKLADTFRNHLAAQRGTELHNFAKEAIRLNQRLPRNRKTLNLYVNDGIGYRMVPEQVLYYSPHCFGTVDTISFRNNKLRIHDLKTGVSPASMRQLEIYAALFCLEYKYDPFKIEIELRIYKDNDIVVHHPEPELIRRICDTIISFDKQINAMLIEAA